MASRQGLHCMPVIFQAWGPNLYCAANVTIALFQWQYEQSYFNGFLWKWHVYVIYLAISVAIVLYFSYGYQMANACV